MKAFESKIEVRWNDCDPNRHVRHSAYYDYAAHARIRYFAALGFDTKQFSKIQMGPILFKEECTFLKELSLDDTVYIKLSKGPITPDGSRRVIHHEVYNQEGDKCAHLSVHGAWMDLSKRKLTIPPEEMLVTINHLPEGEAFIYQKQNK